ncbi:hypothetical protein B0H66DRAFT_547770 [Apodospora peruviana]|uniref:Uncharacterized protein n=1 Tax=Apodospora peruviana TaxID=516989 RepID=A0AAE0IHE8_9PEZI|nr:hypothetical protein B0H66DRAFT_547770 [Apodospora peruviana]
MLENYPFAARIKPMMKNRFRPVSDWKGPYVDSHLLDKVNARVTGLDLDTGKPTTGEQFIKPLSPQAGADLLEQTKPFHLDEPDNFFSELQPCGLFDDSVLTEDAENEARFFFQFIDYSLTRNENEDGFGTTIIPHLSRWGMFQSNIQRLTRIHPTRNDVEWQVQGVFRCCTGPLEPDSLCTRTLDTSKPQLSCFLSNLNPPRDGELTTGELNAVILLALSQAAKKEYQGHQVFPITVVCGSDRTVRIVQGLVDLPKQAVELRVSPIVQFPRGKDTNWDGFRTLLGWFLGNPVGKTT